MRMFTWRNFSLLSFYLYFLSFCTSFSVSATSTWLMSTPDDIGIDIDPCKIVYCGRGTCKRTQNEILGFNCECDSGWKKLNVNNFEFPPCILPNCTVNVGCDNGPLPSKPVSPVDPANPCLVNLCGDGKCVTTSGLDFKCQCNEGSANVLNDPKMICLKKCALGGDCNGLGLGFLTPDAGTPPATTNSSSPQTGSGEMLNFPREFYMLTIMILAMIFQRWI